MSDEPEARRQRTWWESPVVIVVALGALGAVAAYMHIRGRDDSGSSAARATTVPPPGKTSELPAAAIVAWAEGNIGTSQSFEDGLYNVDQATGAYAQWQFPLCRWPSAFDASSKTWFECKIRAASADHFYAKTETGKLFLIDRQGGAKELELPSSGSSELGDGPISVSWDGSTLAFARSTDAFIGPLLVRGTPLTVQAVKLADYTPELPIALSPTGDRVAYFAAGVLTVADTSTGAKIKDLDWKVERRTLPPSSDLASYRPWAGSVHELAWSPEGQHILVVAGQDLGKLNHPGRRPRGLWVVSLESGAARELTLPPPEADPYGDNHWRVGWAAFSPDGRQLALLSDVESECGHPLKGGVGDCECDTSVYVLSVDGSSVRRTSQVRQGCGRVYWLR